MSAHPPAADDDRTDGRPWGVQAVWVQTAPGTGSIGHWPEARPAGRLFLVTNAPEHLAELLAGSEAAAGWAVVDFAELYRLVHAEASAESLTEMLAAVTPPHRPTARPAPPLSTTDGARGLWQAWRALSDTLSRTPLWVIESAEAAYRELGEPAITQLLGRVAHDARRHGRGAGTWLDAFPPEVRRVDRTPPPPLSDCSPLDAAAAERLLAPDGALAGRVPGYEPRPGQLTMLRAVVEAFNSGSHLLVEAGTGVGKSLAYLLPAALWAQLNDVPVVISTNTKNLQTQLIEKDLPAVQGLLGETSLPAGPGAPAPRPLRTALIKGRTNYLCLRRLGYLLEHGALDLPRHELRQFVRSLFWAVRTADGDLDALSGGAAVEPSFMAQLSSLGEECAGRACRTYRRCFLQKARERALRADLIVANHALVFAELGTPGVALPAHAQLIFDEAHNLEEAATRHFSVELSPARLTLVLRRLAVGHGRRSGGALETLRRHFSRGGALGGHNEARQAMRRTVRDARAQVDAVRAAGRHLFAALHDLLPPSGEARRFKADTENPAADAGNRVVALGEPPIPDAAWRTVRESQAGLRDALAALTDALTHIMDGVVEQSDGELNLLSAENSELGGAVEGLKALALDLELVLAARDPDHVFWVQRARTREALGEAWAAPLEVGQRLSESLYAHKQSVIFCSATLSVGGSFRFMGGRLGLENLEPGRIRFCVAASPFDYARQCAVLVPSFLPEPGAADRSYVEELSTLLTAVSVTLGGRTLGLFTSYEMLRHCAKRLAAPLEAAGIRLLVQGESGSRDQLTRLFRRGERSVLLGTHSFWEGVDVVGDALSCVVLARLPFVSPAEPVFGARCERLDRIGHASFGALSLPTAVIRFRQGFGRLIRHREDRGLVIVADTRVFTKRYGLTFRRSLPCSVEPCGEAAAILSRLAELVPRNRSG